MGPDIVAIWMGRILLAVLTTFLLIWMLRRVGDGLTASVEWIEARLERRGRGIAVRSVEVLSADAISGFVRSLVGTMRVLAMLALLYGWLLVVAWALDASHKVFDIVVTPLVTALSTVGYAVLGFIPNLAMLVVIVTLARFASRVVGVLGNAVAERRLVVKWLDPELVTLTRRIATILIWVTALVMVAPYLPGSDSRAFLGITIMLGILVSFGSTSVTSNLLAGLVLVYARAYRVGDRVRIGDVVGDVTFIGVFTMRIRTLDHEEVIVPNALVQSGPIWNYTTSTATVATAKTLRPPPPPPFGTPSAPPVSIPIAPPPVRVTNPPEPVAPSDAPARAPSSPELDWGS